MDEIDTPLLTPEEMDAVFTDMSEQEKRYLRVLISRLVQCFAKKSERALVLFSNNKEDRVSICSVNCEEISAANMLSHANDVMSFACTHDAPAKENFN